MKFSAIKHWLSFEPGGRCTLVAAVMMGVVAIKTGWDTDLLTKLSFVNTAKAEEHLIGGLHPEKAAVRTASVAESRPALAGEGALPDLGGAIGWLNSAPLSSESLRGKVVLVVR
jgi:hypothetical protein